MGGSAPDSEALTARTVASIHDCPATAWNACAGPADPFLRHAFLACLEDSGSAAPATGWRPAHILIEDRHGTLCACAPAYLKSHSWGEYVFDQGWAEALARVGEDYYPKLLVAVPFTPATGPRLLAAPGFGGARARQLLANAIRLVAERAGASSAHVNFLPRPEWQALGAAGYLQRRGIQFHWTNRDYGDFDAFLATLRQRKRKAIRRERRAAAQGGIEIRRLTGNALTEEVWDAFYAFYRDTGQRKWGMPYLSRAFFTLLGRRMGEAVLLIMARRDGRWIAGALNMIGADTLYGRYWGAIADVPMLHFECCYYQAIEHAIAAGLARVEAGAQGGHKLQRGYLPVATYSAHWLRHEGLAAAVARFLEEEDRHVEEQLEAIGDAYSPFRQT